MYKKVQERTEKRKNEVGLTQRVSFKAMSQKQNRFKLPKFVLTCKKWTDICSKINSGPVEARKAKSRLVRYCITLQSTARARNNSEKIK